MSFQHGKDHYKKEYLLCMQDIHTFLDLSGLILDPHQKAAYGQPTHEKQGQHQPVIGPQGNITVDAGRNKGRGVQPYMIDEKSVEVWLHTFQKVAETDPFGRKVDVCGKEEDHAQVARTGCQVIIGVIGVYNGQQQKAADKYGPSLDWSLPK